MLKGSSRSRPVLPRLDVTRVVRSKASIQVPLDGSPVKSKFLLEAQPPAIGSTCREIRHQAVSVRLVSKCSATTRRSSPSASTAIPAAKSFNGSELSHVARRPRLGSPGGSGSASQNRTSQGAVSGQRPPIESSLSPWPEHHVRHHNPTHAPATIRVILSERQPHHGSCLRRYQVFAA